MKLYKIFVRDFKCFRYIKVNKTKTFMTFFLLILGQYKSQMRHQIFIIHPCMLHFYLLFSGEMTDFISGNVCWTSLIIFSEYTTFLSYINNRWIKPRPHPTLFFNIKSIIRH